MPGKTIIDLLTLYSDTISVIITTWIGGWIRFLYEVKEWRTQLNFKWMLLAVLMASAIWYMSVWVLTSWVWITDVKLIWSISMVLWFLYSEILKWIMNEWPAIISSVVNRWRIKIENIDKTK